MLGGRIGAGSPRADVAHATEDAWWARRWRSWAPWPLDGFVLVIAACAVVVDIASAWGDVALGALGRVPVSPALPIAVLVAACLGGRSLGWSRPAVRVWREYAAVGGGVLVLATAAYAVDVGGAPEAAGLVVAALAEELVFRLALLLLVGALAARVVGRDWRDPSRWGTGPGIVALGAGALAFSALPGHVDQMHGPASIVSFASLALVLGWVVLRTGVLWPAIIAHCVLNLATITALVVDAPAGLALGLAASTLLALVAAADVAGRRSGRLRPVPSIIDLTAVRVHNPDRATRHV